MITHGLVICTPTRLIEQSGCTDRAPETTIPGNQPAFADVSAPDGLRATWKLVGAPASRFHFVAERTLESQCATLRMGTQLGAGDRS
jgi:hypothetical protein